jgi:hypothetical protein
VDDAQDVDLLALDAVEDEMLFDGKTAQPLPQIITRYPDPREVA